MAEGCLFCRILGGAIPAPRLYEDGRCVVIADIAPQAPVHLLVIPKEHLSGVADLGADHEALVGHLVAVAAEQARQRGLDGTGYRLVFNHGSDARQTLLHLHLHLLGGRMLGDMG